MEVFTEGLKENTGMFLDASAAARMKVKTDSEVQTFIENMVQNE
jgi:hypothetical protein